MKFITEHECHDVPCKTYFLDLLPDPAGVSETERKSNNVALMVLSTLRGDKQLLLKQQHGEVKSFTSKLRPSQPPPHLLI